MFEDAEALAEIPLDLAANAGAWKAWQAHRTRIRREQNNLNPASKHNDARASSVASVPHRSNVPEEWNWDGVWQERVQNGIKTSISDPVLYGINTGDDPVRLQLSVLWSTANMHIKIRFAKVDDDLFRTIKHEILRE